MMKESKRDKQRQAVKRQNLGQCLVVMVNRVLNTVAVVEDATFRNGLIVQIFRQKLRAFAKVPNGVQRAKEGELTGIKSCVEFRKLTKGNYLSRSSLWWELETFLPPRCRRQRFPSKSIDP